MKTFVRIIILALILQTSSLLVSTTTLHDPGCEAFYAENHNTLQECLSGGNPDLVYNVTRRGIPGFYETKQGVTAESAIRSKRIIIDAAIVSFVVSLVVSGALLVALQITSRRRATSKRRT